MWVGDGTGVAVRVGGGMEVDVAVGVAEGDGVKVGEGVSVAASSVAVEVGNCPSAWLQAVWMSSNKKRMTNFFIYPSTICGKTSAGLAGELKVMCILYTGVPPHGNKLLSSSIIKIISTILGLKCAARG